MHGLPRLARWDSSGMNAAMISAFSVTVLAAVRLPWFVRALLSSHPDRKQWQELP